MKKLMFLSIVLGVGATAFTQTELPPRPLNLDATVTETISYPSLVLRQPFVQVNLTQLFLTGFSDDLADYTKIVDASKNPVWELRAKGEKGEALAVTASKIEIKDQNSGQLWITPERWFPSGTEFEVWVKAPIKGQPGKTQWVYHKKEDSSKIIAPPVRPQYELSLEPKQVEDAELLDGSKKGLTQFAIDLLVPSIDFGSMNGYLRSKSLVSTQSLDTQTRLELVFGLEKLLSVAKSAPPNPYSGQYPSSLDGIGWPVHGFFEAGVVGNQLWSNASFVSTLGFRTLLPVGPLKSGSTSERYSRTPVIDMGVQYANWFKQDARIDTARDEKNTFRITSGLEWGPIYFLGSKDWAFEFALRGWYFPTTRGRGGLPVRNLESVFEASLLIPINNSTQAFRISYITGAQESNNFVRTSSLSLGFELKT